jgi:hypothetical protein
MTELTSGGAFGLGCHSLKDFYAIGHPESSLAPAAYKTSPAAQADDDVAVCLGL